MTDVTSPHLPTGVTAALRLAGKTAFANAGQTYNTGNGVALCAAFAAAVGGSAGSGGALANLGVAFFGSLPALLVTAGTLAFFAGGARYDAAYRDEKRADAAALTQGHALSGLGAIMVALGLAGLATTPFAALAALCGGVLHASGKIGSAACAHQAAWKWLPLASRTFSLISLLAGLGAAPTLVQSVTLALLILSIGIWARADIMLLSDEQAGVFASLVGIKRRVCNSYN